MSLIIGFWKRNGYQGRLGICLRAIITRPQMGRMKAYPSLFLSCFTAVALCNAEPVIRTAWEWGRNAEIRRDGPLQGPPSWELKERGGCEISLWGAAWHWSVQTCNLHPISFRKPRKTVWWEQQEGRLSWYVSLSLILIFVFWFGMNDQRSPWPNALQIGGFRYAVGFQWDEKTGACRLSGCRSVSFPSDTGQ